MSATPDLTFCNQCGIDLTGYDGPGERNPCPNCGSLTRKFEATLATHSRIISGRGGIVASLPTIDATGQVFAPTIVAERVVTDFHFEHVVQTWRQGDGWIVNMTSPNDTPF